MKQQIIDQMRAELTQHRECLQDFKHDLKTLNDYTGPFFWMVRDSGTTLCLIGMEQILDATQYEARRFSIFRDLNSEIASLCIYREPAKFFYYDGYALARVTKDEVLQIWSDLFSPVRERLKAQYPHEYEICNQPLPLKPSHERVAEKLQQALEFAAQISDPSLTQCLEHLTNWTRFSVDHYILLRYGASLNRYGFYWTEILANDYRLHGVIEYDADAQGNHWQIHT